MNQFKKTKKTTIFMAILVVVIAVVYIVFFISIKNKNESVSLVINEVDIAIEKEVKLKSVKSLIEDIEDEREKLDIYFVDDEEVIDFIENIEDLAGDTGVGVEVMSVDISDDRNNTPQQNSISELLLLSLKVEGSWDDLFQFILLVEGLPFKIDISKVNIEAIYSSGEKKESSGNWKGLLSLGVLKLKEDVNNI
jgi:hypothetical protein